MTTLADFRSNLRDIGNFPANDTRVTDAMIDREINRALRRIAMLHDWPWLQDDFLLITASDIRGYFLPNDALRVILVGSVASGRVLEPTSHSELFISLGNGSPTAYCVWNDQIVLSHDPADSEEFIIRYVRRERSLSNDLDSPLIPDYWDSGVYDAALVELHRAVKQMEESGLAEARFQTWVKETRDNIPQTRQAPRIRVRPGSFI